MVWTTERRAMTFFIARLFLCRDSIKRPSALSDCNVFLVMGPMGLMRPMGLVGLVRDLPVESRRRLATISGGNRGGEPRNLAHVFDPSSRSPIV
jgi:hypothetical protein